VIEDLCEISYLRYRKSLDVLPAKALTLLAIPNFDVSGFLEKNIQREEKWQEIQRKKENAKLPEDGICLLENLYLDSGKV
jgi:hypothetical protein